MARIDVIRHVAFEDLGLWNSLLNTGAHSLRYWQAGVDDLAACITSPADLVIILGGPIGAYETEQYPFLANEIQLIRNRLERGLPILGICLGAQLIAAAAGARVYSSGIKEIGWGSIALTPAGNDSCLRHLAASDHIVLHWHGDTFDLPTGATLLASTSLIKHQAFSLGNNVLALQFHVEADPATLDAWLIGHACELSHAAIQPVELRRATHLLPKMHREGCEKVLTSWLQQVGF